MTRRLFSTQPLKNAKVVLALYDDPVTGYPPKYSRDGIPELPGYADFRKMGRILDGEIGQTMPTPKGLDIKPGELLGCVSGELGIRKYLESNGHKLIVTSDKDGEDSLLAK